MLEIEELILKETPFLSIKDITQEEWVALDYELEVYDRAGKDYDLRKLPMLPFILREIHNNETTFFNIPGFIRDGFQFRKLVAIYNPRLKRILRKREDVEMNRVETTKFLGELLKSSRLTRINNALEAMPAELEEAQTKLSNVEHQLETAKIEVNKPFLQEAELSEKLERLAELDALLNMGEKEDSIIENTTEDIIEPVITPANKFTKRVKPRGPKL